MYLIKFTFMNSRLQQFLELENLTPARLADMLGVQRSGLSHILSGRNKPGYDFINKLLLKFPAINAEWLLTGKGKPYKEMNLPSYTGERPSSFHTTQNEKQYTNIQSVKQPLTDQPILDRSEINSGFSGDLYDENLFSAVESQRNETEKAILNTGNEVFTDKKSDRQPPENRINPAQREIVRKERSVKRVIIFYNDGSFEELFPQK